MKTNLKALFAVGITILGITFITSCTGSSKKETGGSEVKEELKEMAENKDPMKNKGIGPVTNLPLASLDPSLADKGKAIFEQKCAACHKFDVKYVGPALQDVTKRRTPEWIMNMILNPVEMTQKDPIAKELLETLMTQMTFQNVTQEDSRAILEYFRQKDSK